MLWDVRIGAIRKTATSVSWITEHEAVFVGDVGIC